MTLDEKIGQMTQADMTAVHDGADVHELFLGSVLSGGDSLPVGNSPEVWADMTDGYQTQALSTRLGIPLIYGVDAVHGDGGVKGAVLFPHNIGLGATRNPELVQRAARVTARETAGSGVRWAFAPCMAVARDERWGRTYESFGESPELAETLGAAVVRGLQDAERRSGRPGLRQALRRRRRHVPRQGPGRHRVPEEELRRICTCRVTSRPSRPASAA